LCCWWFDRRGCLLSADGSGCGEAIAAAAAAAAQIPAKTEAAEETLRAVRQQMEQIQDEVSRQALLSRCGRLKNLARGELQVVVFGTGQLAKPLW